MPAPYGVTQTGFNAPTVDEADLIIQADLQGIFGAGIDVGSRGNFGQLAGIIGERYADAYAMGQDVYNAATPDGAAGAALDFVNGLRGVIRLAPESSTVLETLTGAASTALPIDQVVAVNGLGTQFETSIASNLPAVAPAAWASGTNYAQGAVIEVTDAQGSHLYIAKTDGISGTTSSPSGYGTAIQDNTVIWAYAGELVSTWTAGDDYLAAQMSGQAGSRVNLGGVGGTLWLCTTGPAIAASAPPGAVIGGIAYGTKPWVQGTAYLLNSYVTYGGHTWKVTTSGAPTISSFPPDGGLHADGYQWLNVDDGYVWQFLGLGQVAVDVPCNSVQTGPIQAGAGSLGTIVTPVAGWLGCYNVAAAAIGQNLELDDGGVPGPGYRIRGELEIRGGGSGYLTAIQQAVLAALIALNEDYASAQVTVVENTGNVPDGQGRPAHSFEVICGLPADTPGNTLAAQQAIANAIYLNKPTGIATCSEGGVTEMVVILDSQGNPHPIFFSVTKPTACAVQMTVHIDPAVITEAAPYPNTQAAVTSLLTAFTAALGSSRNFVAGAMAAQAFGLNVAGQRPGVLDVTAALVGTPPLPVGGVYVAIDAYDYPTLIAANVAITVVADDL